MKIADFNENHGKGIHVTARSGAKWCIIFFCEMLWSLPAQCSSAVRAEYLAPVSIENCKSKVCNPRMILVVYENIQLRLRVRWSRCIINPKTCSFEIAMNNFVFVEIVNPLGYSE